jgi:hypothetical protein
MAGSEVVQIDGSIGTGIAGDSNAIGEDADFDGLPDLITAMIDGVDEGFFQCFIGVVEESLRFGLAPLLDNNLLDEDGIDIGKGLFDHAVQRTFENLFGEDVASRSVRELDNVDLGLGKKAGGIFVEKEQAHIEGFEHFSGAGDDVHLSAELGEIHRIHVVKELATHLPQKIPNQGQVQIVEGSLMSDPIVKRNGGCQAYEFHFIVVGRPYGGGGLADVIGKFFGFLREGYGGFVGPCLAARRPEDQDIAILDHISGDDRMVGWPDPVAQGEDVLLDFVYPVRGDSSRRQ